MKILGLDPGFGRLGYGVIEVTRDTPRMVDCGCFETSKEMEHAERLRSVAEEVKRLIGAHAPERVGVERLFFSKNVKTAMKVAEARGVVLMAASKTGARVVECSPQEVKIAVTGYGAADKNQVQQMVKIILKLKELPTPDDAADALALAIAVSRVV